MQRCSCDAEAVQRFVSIVCSQHERLETARPGLRSHVRPSESCPALRRGMRLLSPSRVLREFWQSAVETHHACVSSWSGGAAGGEHRRAINATPRLSPCGRQVARAVTATPRGRCLGGCAKQWAQPARAPGRFAARKENSALIFQAACAADPEPITEGGPWPGMVSAMAPSPCEQKSPNFDHRRNNLTRTVIRAVWLFISNGKNLRSRLLQRAQLFHGSQ